VYVVAAEAVVREVGGEARAAEAGQPIPRVPGVRDGPGRIRPRQAASIVVVGEGLCAEPELAVARVVGTRADRLRDERAGEGAAHRYAITGRVVLIREIPQRSQRIARYTRATSREPRS
jgi:hypothetical protein